jgi:hypothetical protein
MPRFKVPTPRGRCRRAKPQPRGRESYGGVPTIVKPSCRDRIER